MPLATTSRHPMGAWHRECCVPESWGLGDSRSQAPLQPGCFLPGLGPLAQLAGRLRRGARHREDPRPRLPGTPYSRGQAPLQPGRLLLCATLGDIVGDGDAITIQGQSTRRA